MVGPYIKDKNTTKKISFNLLIALIPLIIFAFYKNGIVLYSKGYTDMLGMFYPLIFILVASISTFVFETLYAIIFIKKDVKDFIKDSYSFIPGILVSLIVSINTPILVLLLACFIATIIKMIFYSFNKNIINSTVIAVLIIFGLSILNNYSYLNKYELTKYNDIPLYSANELNNVNTYDKLVKPYGDLRQFFLGNVPGGLGETSILFCLIGFIYLFVKKAIKWIIPISCVLTCFVMCFAIGYTCNLGVWFPLFEIMSGSLIFASIFIASDSLTTPVTPIGQVIYGILLGALTIFFRFFTPMTDGIIISILIVSLLSNLIDKICSKARFEFKKSLLLFVISWILIIVLIFVIGIKYKNVKLNQNIANINYLMK